MCFRHWNRPRGRPDVRNGSVRFNDPGRTSSPRDTQKADGIMSRRSIVESVIPMLVKGFTIHRQYIFFEDGSRERDRRLEMPAVETLDALFHPSQCGRRYVRLSVRQAYASVATPGNFVPTRTVRPSGVHQDYVRVCLSTSHDCLFPFLSCKRLVT